VNQVERATSCFEEGFSCSQSVASAYGPSLGLDRDIALKVSAAFGGGMAHMGETCGAVSGALMVIGLKHGRTRADDEEANDKTYDLAREFVDRFKSRNGSVICRELLGYDIGTPEGKEQIEERELWTIRCAKFVQDAAEIVGEVLGVGR
jgi:C_GCAxxG_C_C family probable redox protein